MLPLALFPDTVPLALDGIVLDAANVILLLRTASASARCPLCGQPSHRTHSRYARRVHDLPSQGRRTVLHLTARRFICPNVACPRKVFCERLPDLVPRCGRSTSRLAESQRAIAYSLGGEAGCRLAAQFGMPASADTMLRRIKQDASVAQPAAPRVIGVDDWAIRKGHTYGTLIIDIERCQALELLPGRDGEGLKAWLRQHPEVEVLCRDRWPCFTEAANEAAPQATQVADRWHLLKNAREALERFLDRHAKKVRALFAPAGPVPAPVAGPDAPPAATATAAPPVAPEPAPSAKQQQRLDRYREVRRRHSEGQPLRQIARELGLAWRVVSRYASSDHCPDWRPGRAGPTQAADHRERIDAWLAQGHRNVSDLHRQLQAEGSSLRYDL